MREGCTGMNLEDVGQKAYWCDELIKAIDKIAKDKYPEIKIWVDTGSKLNECLAVLEQVYKDLKVKRTLVNLRGSSNDN